MPPGDRKREEQRLLARTPVIQSACDLDLLVFLHRHPRMLLTTEQLARFVGYDLKDIAKALEAFIEAGLLRRTAQQSAHAAGLFLLLLDGPQGPGLSALLEMVSTREGRERIIEALNGGGPSEEAAFWLRQWRMNLRLNEQRVQGLRHQVSSSGLPLGQKNLSKQTYIVIEQTYCSCQQAIEEIANSIRYLGKCEEIEARARLQVIRTRSLPAA